MRGVRWRAVAAWTGYGVAVFLVCLVATFPFDHLQAGLLAAASARAGVETTVDGWGYRWPVGIAWNGMTVKGGGREARADAVQVETDLVGALFGRPVIHVTLDGPGAQGKTMHADGLVTLESWDGSGAGQLVATVEQVDLSGLAAGTPGPALTKGAAKLTVDHRWSDAATGLGFWGGEGTWEIELADLQVEHVPIGPMEIPSIGFATFKARIRCQAGSCRIEGLAGEGPDGAVGGEGVVTLRTPMPDSAVTLSLTVTISDAFKQRVPLAALLPQAAGAPLKVTLTGPLSKLQVAL